MITWYPPLSRPVLIHYDDILQDANMMQELTRLRRDKHELISRITTLKQHILELESQESEAIHEVRVCMCVCVCVCVYIA